MNWLTGLIIGGAVAAALGLLVGLVTTRLGVLSLGLKRGILARRARGVNPRLLDTFPGLGEQAAVLLELRQ